MDISYLNIYIYTHYIEMYILCHVVSILISSMIIRWAWMLPALFPLALKELLETLGPFFPSSPVTYTVGSRLVSHETIQKGTPGNGTHYAGNCSST